MSKITGGVFQSLDKVMQSPGTPDAASQSSGDTIHNSGENSVWCRRNSCA